MRGCPPGRCATYAPLPIRAKEALYQCVLAGHRGGSGSSARARLGLLALRATISSKLFRCLAPDSYSGALGDRIIGLDRKGRASGQRGLRTPFSFASGLRSAQTAGLDWVLRSWGMAAGLRSPPAAPAERSSCGLTPARGQGLVGEPCPALSGEPLAASVRPGASVESGFGQAGRFVAARGAPDGRVAREAYETPSARAISAPTTTNAGQRTRIQLPGAPWRLAVAQ